MLHAKRSMLTLLLGLIISGPVRAADRFTVILDWFVNANHESLLSAQYSGAYARHGLEVRFIAPADPGSPPRLVAAHQADLCIGYEPQLALLDEAGLGLLRVGTLEDTPLNALITLGGGPIHTLADLRGRRIGSSVGPLDEPILRAMLGSVGLKPSDVSVTEVNFQIEQALMSHRVDAVIGGQRNYEFIDLQQRGLHPVLFLPEEHGVPPYDELILLARRDEAGDPRIPRFLDALAEGTAALINHPDAMWQDFIHEHPDLDTPLNHAAWFASLPRMAKAPARLDRARYAAFERFMVAQGSLRAALPVSAIAIDPTADKTTP